MRFFCTLLVALFTLAGCASERVASGCHTRHEVIQIAMAFAQRSGFHLDDYGAPRASFVLDSGDHSGDWWVVFPEKPPQHPDSDIIVSVDDSSAVARFINPQL
jgi:hypothetical protein